MMLFLFVIFIYDLADVMKNCVKLFADETKVISSVKNSNGF